eukprot:1183534-Prorocentrum_minimum.AAC.3
MYKTVWMATQATPPLRASRAWGVPHPSCTADRPLHPPLRGANPGVDGRKDSLRVQFNSRPLSTVDTRKPFNAQHFEYSAKYPTYIPCRQTATWLADSRLRGLTWGVPHPPCTADRMRAAARPKAKLGACEPIRHKKCRYILMTDQSDSARTYGFTLSTLQYPVESQSDTGSAGIFS